MKVIYSSRNVAKNSVMSVIYKILSMLLSFISAPLVLNLLGEAKYGIWASLGSIVSWIYYLDLGIGNGLRIKLSESFAKEDSRSIKKYVSVSYALLSSISMVALIAIFVIVKITNVRKLLNIDSNIGENVNYILFTAFFFVCINFVFSLINNIYYATQNASAVSALGIIGQLIFIIGLFIYLRFGSRLILAVAAIEGISQMLKNIIGSIYAFAKYPECRPSLRFIDWSYSQGIIAFGILIFVGNIAALVLNSTDNIIILHYIGAEAVTPYAFCIKYFTIISGIFAVIVIPLQSAYTMAYSNNDFGWISKNLKRALSAYLLFCIGTVLAGLFFRKIMHVWLQKDLNFTSGLIMWTVIYTVLLMAGHVSSTFLIGIGRIKETTISGFVMAVLNIPISILLSVNFKMGVEGVILGSVISIFIGVTTSFVVCVSMLKKMKVFIKG